MLLLAAPCAFAQRYSMETQLPGGFLLLDGLGIIGTDVIACGHVEQGFRFGAVCRMSNGVIEWSRKLRNSTPYYANAFYQGLAITSNSDILVVGQEVLNSPNCHIARLDQTGALLWSTSLNVGPGQQYFSDVVEAPDGSIYAVGGVESSAEGDVVVARFDPGGAPTWVRVLNEPDLQYSRGLLFQNDTLHVLAATATNGGDLALLAFATDGTLVRSHLVGTSADERPLAMTSDGSGGLVISFSRDYYNMFVVRVPPVPGTSLPTWSIDTPMQLDMVGGLYFDPATQECMLLGNRAWMAYALRIALPTNTVVWERSFPDLYSFFSMALSNDGTTVVASGGPFGFLPNGSYPVEFAQFDPLTGNDVFGGPCAPWSASPISISDTSVPCTMVPMSTRIPSLQAYSGIEVQDLFLTTNYCGPIVLPVELISWTAQSLDQSVRLSWSTGSEHNSDRFIIERSAEGSDWSPIGQVAAAGHSTVLREYAWDDLEPLSGVGYYRLRQVDADGSGTLSDVLVVDRSTLPDRPLVHPNPVAPGQPVTASERVILRDLSGRLIAGPTEHFTAPQLPGVYVVHGAMRIDRLVVR
ncbi:MAG TPA: hypothetical protein PKJ19_07105 [Flavobacteriales bacterium]|nr:hypothetical protein [Flavobacteriales bacterium]HNU55177.1 hypothetical protein [Flavobacteriales bacterium]